MEWRAKRKRNEKERIKTGKEGRNQIRKEERQQERKEDKKEKIVKKRNKGEKRGKMKMWDLLLQSCEGLQICIP
jgi:hypothetical protein